ncbi:MAG: DUF6152 family protein [Pseudomonadota bacterium]
MFFLPQKSAHILKSACALVTLTGLFSISYSTHAHHAFSAEFDAQKPVELSGTVTQARWVNPHSWVYIDVKDASGNITNWGFEFGAPFSLKQKGLTKTTLPVGAEIKLKGYRAKSGENYAYSTSIVLANGQVFQTGGAQDAPEPPRAAQ